jgi:hypothetical protein
VRRGTTPAPSEGPAGATSATASTSGPLPVGTGPGDVAAYPAAPGAGVGRRAAWTLATQALSSGSNFLLTAVVLAAAPPRMFSVFAICVTCYLLLLQLARYVIGVPVLMAGTGAVPAGGAEGPADRHAMAGFAVVAGLAAAPLLLLAGVLWREATPQLLLLAAPMPFLFAQDALRHLAIGSHRPQLAALGDAAWVAVQSAGFVVALAAGTESAAVLLAVWAGAGIVSALLLAALLHVRPALPAATGWLRSNRDLCRRLAGEFAVNSGSYYALSFGLVAFAGAAQLGHLRAAQTLFGPASVLLLGGATLGVPESVRIREHGSGMVRFAAVLSASMTVLAVLCGAAVYALLPVVGPELFPSWRAVRDVIPWLTLFGAAIGAGAGPVSALRALDRSRWVLGARTTTSGLALAVGLPAGAWFGARGALAGLAVGESVLAARAWARLHAEPGGSPTGGGPPC